MNQNLWISIRLGQSWLNDYSPLDESEPMDTDDGYVSEASNEELLQNRIANCNVQ